MKPLARVLLLLRRLTVDVALISSCLAAVAAVRGIGASGELMYSEGGMLHNMIQVRDGAPLYADFQRPPFNMAVYFPLYYWAVGIGARLGHLDVAGMVTLARSLTAAATIVVAVLLAAIGRQVGLSGRSAAVGAGLFLSSYVVQPWGYTARPDMLALAFSLAGLWVGMRWPTRRGVLGAGLLFVAAFYTKQSYVVAVGALTLALLHARQWGRALVLVGLWWACAIGGFVMLQAATGGLFALNVVSSQALPMQITSVVYHTSLFVTLSILPLVLACLGWGGGAAAGWPHPVVRWYAVLAAAIGVFTVAKVGSHYNYFLELGAALAILAGRGLDRLEQGATVPPRPPSAGLSRRQRLGQLVTTVAMTCAVAGALLPVPGLLQLGLESPDSSDLVRLLLDTPGDVLTERESLAVLRAGKPAPVADPLAVATVNAVDRWDGTELKAMIAARTFSLIVLARPVEASVDYQGASWWPGGTRETIGQHYQLVDRVGRHYLYAPARPQPSAGSETASDQSSSESAAAERAPGTASVSDTGERGS